MEVDSDGEDGDDFDEEPEDDIGHLANVATQNVVAVDARPHRAVELSSAIDGVAVEGEMGNEALLPRYAAAGI